MNFRKHLIGFGLIGLLLIMSCTQNSQPESMQIHTTPLKEVQVNELQALFDSAKVTGATVVFDPGAMVFYSNDFDRCRKGYLPASTFKIPNSLIALETGIVENESTVFEWDGKKRRLKTWERDLTFREAFHASCVPCYQEIARKVGADTMRKYLDLFHYGDMVFDSSTIDLFWLEGNSRITAFGQIDFLKDFYEEKLPLSAHTYSVMKNLIVIEKNDRYTLSGKTGWAIRNENNLGWFVGYIESAKGVRFFATNLEPGPGFNMDEFTRIRAEITMKALEVTVKL